MSEAVKPYPAPVRSALALLAFIDQDWRFWQVAQCPVPNIP